MKTLTAEELMQQLREPKTQPEPDDDTIYMTQQGQIEARAQGCMLGTWREAK